MGTARESHRGLDVLARWIEQRLSYFSLCDTMSLWVHPLVAVQPLVVRQSAAQPLVVRQLVVRQSAAQQLVLQPLVLQQLVLQRVREHP